MDFYNGNFSGLIEFSAAVAENPFGSVLLELAERSYDDVDTAVLDISETLTSLGFNASPELVIGLMTGEIVPDEEVVEVLSELAIVEDNDSLTERNISKLYQGAIEAYEIAEAILSEDDEYYDEDEYEDEYEGAEADYYDEDEYEDEDEELVVALDEDTEATFSRYFDEVDELRARQVITDELSDLREYADQLLSERCITPHAHGLMFSRSQKDDFVNFSQATNESGLDPEDYLMCMNFALNLFEEMGPIAGTNFQFSSMVDQEISGAPMNFSSNSGQVQSEAREMLDLLRGDN